MPELKILKTIDDAEAILDYFNGFHDGFIKRIILKSSDEFEAWAQQRCTGNLDLELTLAHYNYAAGQRPYNQLVFAEFQRVQELNVDFGGQAHEWSILNMLITESVRSREDGSSEPCFKVVLRQSRLEGTQWTPHEDLVFTCLGALFIERPTPE